MVAVFVLDLGLHVAERFNDFFGLGVAGAGFGNDLEHGRVRVFIRHGQNDLLDTGDLLDFVFDLFDIVQRVVTGDDLSGHDQWPVVAGAELLVDQVKGCTRRGPLRLAPVVRQRELQFGRRDRENAQGTHDHDDGDEWELGRHRHPAPVELGCECFLLGGVGFLRRGGC